MPTSPDVANYFVGKGILKWKGTDDTEYRDLGNAPMLEITPQMARLPHNTARLGIRRQDFNPIAAEAWTVKFHLEEFTPENLALALVGTLTPGTPDLVQVGGSAGLIGSLRLIGTNDIGEKKQVDIAIVSIAPSAAVSFIGDNYGVLEVTGEIGADPTTGIFWEVRSPITEEIIL